MIYALLVVSVVGGVGWTLWWADQRRAESYRALLTAFGGLRSETLKLHELMTAVHTELQTYTVVGLGEKVPKDPEMEAVKRLTEETRERFLASMMSDEALTSEQAGEAWRQVERQLVGEGTT